jgi:TonB family protein
VPTREPAPEGARPEPPKPVAPPAPREARTGGFADAVASTAPAAPIRREIPRVGGFAASPADPSAAGEGEARVVARVGFGPSTVTAPVAGRAPAAGATVGRAGFGGGAAAGVPASQRPAGAVQAGGFGEVASAAVPRAPRERPTRNLDQPVEVLSKPRPIYTEEARRLRIEGEVVLEVVFVASGQLRVLRVVDGLGHGLDEAAASAVEGIEFKPARRDGRPVDHTATLRVVFRLA